MIEPMISVIVPVYNVEPYLNRCIQSIVDQTYQNLEIILVDDGSPDGSPEICDFWATKDSRIKVIHKENGGLSSARNAGLDICTGDYVTFVDSDDWIAPDYYQNVLCDMMEYSVQIGCAGRYDVDELTLTKTVGLCPASRRLLSPEQMLKQMLTWSECDFSVCDKIFAAFLWADIRFPQGKSSEDVGVLYQVVVRSNGIVMHPQPVYHYFHRKGSITAVNLATKNTHIVEFADEICAFVRQFYPGSQIEADYFKLRCLLYWHRAFCVHPVLSGMEFRFYQTSRRWLSQRLPFVLFTCRYVTIKEKLWYLLILLRMRNLVRWLVLRKH